jgi:hypothetical protein
MTLKHEPRFDIWLKHLAAARSRRGLLRSLGAGLGLAALPLVDPVSLAAKKKKKKKKKGSCGSGETQCPAGYPAACCPSGTTCCQSRIACCSIY